MWDITARHLFLLCPLFFFYFLLVVYLLVRFSRELCPFSSYIFLFFLLLTCTHRSFSEFTKRF
ncbi:hypothetical protein BDZ97DRAFT_755083 [Flammula alnicola]|nr:hypothetical protein BDZ97DRAFT_755083 [Flammula alnicola]